LISIKCARFRNHAQRQCRKWYCKDGMVLRAHLGIRQEVGHLAHTLQNLFNLQASKKELEWGHALQASHFIRFKRCIHTPTVASGKAHASGRTWWGILRTAGTKQPCRPPSLLTHLAL
jgi:hypothetical protein